MASKLLLAVTLACFAALAHGYGSGAPQEACVDMIPKHPVPPKATPPPYTITTSTKVVKAGTPMEVVIAGKSPSDTIRGLLLQARLGDKPVGSFKIPPAAANFAQLLDCGTPDNAVTHKKHEPQDDKNVVAFTWTPPADLKGHIKFRATVALNGAVFWVGVESAPVTVE